MPGPRSYPVPVPNAEHLDDHAVWTFPEPVRPVLPRLQERTAFGDRKEAGVAAWRRLRQLINQVPEEGMGFLTGP